jgi:hypothetical protein
MFLGSRLCLSCAVSLTNSPLLLLFTFLYLLFRSLFLPLLALVHLVDCVGLATVLPSPLTLRLDPLNLSEEEPEWRSSAE